MNLRNKRKNVRRKGGDEGGGGFFTYCGVFVFFLVVAFCCVLGFTAYFNGQSEKLNKGIAAKEKEIYKLQREVDNLKIKIESRSAKKFITSRITYYNLNLHSPEPSQIVYLDGKGSRMDDKGFKFDGRFMGGRNVALARD